jgi:hypothetical protein
MPQLYRYESLKSPTSNLLNMNILLIIFCILKTIKGQIIVNNPIINPIAQKSTKHKYIPPLICLLLLYIYIYIRRKY